MFNLGRTSAVNAAVYAIYVFWHINININIYIHTVYTYTSFKRPWPFENHLHNPLRSWFPWHLLFPQLPGIVCKKETGNKFVAARDLWRWHANTEQWQPRPCRPALHQRSPANLPPLQPWAAAINGASCIAKLDQQRRSCILVRMGNQCICFHVYISWIKITVGKGLW